MIFYQSEKYFDIFVLDTSEYKITQSYIDDYDDPKNCVYENAEL